MPYDPETGEWFDDEDDDDLSGYDQDNEEESPEDPPDPEDEEPTEDYGEAPPEEEAPPPPPPPPPPQQQGTPVGQRMKDMLPQRSLSGQTFRPFEEGGDTGVMSDVSPQQAAMLRQQYVQRTQAAMDAQTPEGQFARTLGQLSAVTPSHSQNIERQRLQNGLTSIDGQVANGTITAQAANMARNLINQRLGPMMIRQSEVPMYMARARYQSMVLQNAQRAALIEQDAEFRTRTLPQRTRYVPLPDGGTATIIENGGTRPPTQIVTPRADQGAQSQQRNETRNQARWDTIQRDMAREVRREVTAAQTAVRSGAALNAAAGYTGWMGGSEPTEAQIQAEALRRATSRFQSAPPGSQQPGAQPGTPPGAQPPPTTPQGQPQERIAGQPPAGQQPTPAQAIRARLQTLPNPAFRNDPALTSRLAEIEQLESRYPEWERMPAAAQSRARALVTELITRMNAVTPAARNQPQAPVQGRATPVPVPAGGTRQGAALAERERQLRSDPAATRDALIQQQLRRGGTRAEAEQRVDRIIASGDIPYWLLRQQF